MDQQQLGIVGEQLACTHLVGKGYKILDKNWRHRKEEIDIVAQISDTVVFVEVKTRENRYAGPPEVHVNMAKQRKIIRAAGAYVEQNNIEQELRFDIIAIIYNQKEKSINHIEEAFYPI